MLKNGKIEHGLLEIGRLGEMSKVTDSRALMILAEYAVNVYRSSPRRFSDRCFEKASVGAPISSLSNIFQQVVH
jgi:hypothetical protein